MGTISKIIFFSKKYFSSDSFVWFVCLNHTLEDDDEVFLISKINRVSQVAYFRMNSLNGDDEVFLISKINRVSQVAYFRMNSLNGEKNACSSCMKSLLNFLLKIFLFAFFWFLNFSPFLIEDISIYRWK